MHKMHMRESFEKKLNLKKKKEKKLNSADKFAETRGEGFNWHAA